MVLHGRWVPLVSAILCAWPASGEAIKLWLVRLRAYTLRLKSAAAHLKVNFGLREIRSTYRSESSTGPAGVEWPP